MSTTDNMIYTQMDYELSMSFYKQFITHFIYKDQSLLTRGLSISF